MRKIAWPRSNPEIYCAVKKRLAKSIGRHLPNYTPGVRPFGEAKAQVCSLVSVEKSFRSTNLKSNFNSELRQAPFSLAGNHGAIHCVSTANGMWFNQHASIPGVPCLQSSVETVKLTWPSMSCRGEEVAHLNLEKYRASFLCFLRTKYRKCRSSEWK